MTLISISLPRLDGGTQSRAALNDEVIADYADKYSRGIFLPDITLFYDGADHWLADGFHRVHGAKQAGLRQINADVRQGTRRDAVLFSVGANADHGLQRTNEDKRRAVITLLDDMEWRQWSDREIARRANVGNKFVGDVRRSLFPEHSEAGERKFVTKHGTTATMQTSNIGSVQPPVAASIDLPVSNESEQETVEAPTLAVGDLVLTPGGTVVEVHQVFDGWVIVRNVEGTQYGFMPASLQYINFSDGDAPVPRLTPDQLLQVKQFNVQQLQEWHSKQDSSAMPEDKNEQATQPADETDLETVEASLPPTQPSSAPATETPTPKAGSGEAVRDELKAKGFSIFKVIRHKDDTYTAGFDSSWKFDYQNALQAAGEYQVQLEDAGYEVLDAGNDIEPPLSLPGTYTPMVRFRVAAEASKSDEWYTPAPIIADARAVLGTIDLDPASCEAAQRTVQAATYYDRDSDGRKRPWFGKVWMNPPYSQPLVSDFVLRLIDEYQRGRIDEAIVVVNNRTDASWCQQLLNAANAVCFTRGRIGFIRFGELRPENRQGQIFAYFGDRPKRFAQVFKKYGLCRELVLIDAEAEA